MHVTRAKGNVGRVAESTKPLACAAPSKRWLNVAADVQGSREHVVLARGEDQPAYPIPSTSVTAWPCVVELRNDAY